MYIAAATFLPTDLVASLLSLNPWAILAGTAGAVAGVVVARRV